MVKRTLIAVSLTMLLAGCSKLQEMRFESVAKEWITAQVNDPASVNFRELRVFQHPSRRDATHALCGEINAKNRLGGYAGWSRFLVVGQPGGIPNQASSGMIESEEDAELFETVWIVNCK